MRAQPCSARTTACVITCAAVLLGSCSGHVSPSASVQSPSPAVTQPASRTEPATSAPAVGPTEMPTAPPLFGNSSLARVMVDRLIVRTRPSTSAPQLVLGSTVPVALNTGDHVFVLSNGRAADGYWWFMVALEVNPLAWAEVPVAWVPSGTQADPWLVPDRAPCPTPTLTSLSTLPGIERVGCDYVYIHFTAHQAAQPTEGELGVPCPPQPGLPAWLVCDNYRSDNWVNADGGTAWEFRLHFDPASGIAPIGFAPTGTIGPAYDITGHFGDAASDDCVTAGWGSAEGQSQWITCAEKFVVDSLQLID